MMFSWPFVSGSISFLRVKWLKTEGPFQAGEIQPFFQLMASPRRPSLVGERSVNLYLGIAQVASLSCREGEDLYRHLQVHLRAESNHAGV
jgi:hypothetical protein